MVKPYGKNINWYKKFKGRPSTQVDGTPIKAVAGVYNLKKLQKPNKTYGYLSGRPRIPVGGTTLGAGVANTGRDNSPNYVNPFYNYLLDNCITRVKTTLGTGVAAAFDIIAPAYDNQLNAGDTFYVVNPFTFNMKKLTVTDDITSTTTLLRFVGVTFTTEDFFPSGSFIIPDFKLLTNKINKGGIYNAFVGSGTGTYLVRLVTSNNWYNTAAYFVSYGSGSFPVASSLTNQLRGGEFYAPVSCTVNSLQLSFYISSSGSNDLEFFIGFYDVAEGGTSVTALLPMVHSSINGAFAANRTFKRNITFTATNTLTQGQGLGVFIRCTNRSAVNLYGSGQFTITPN